MWGRGSKSVSLQLFMGQRGKTGGRRRHRPPARICMAPVPVAARRGSADPDDERGAGWHLGTLDSAAEDAERALSDMALMVGRRSFVPK